MAEIETIRVKAAHPSQGEWVVINAHDFDPAVHVKFDAAAEAKPAKPRTKKVPTHA